MSGMGSVCAGIRFICSGLRVNLMRPMWVPHTSSAMPASTFSNACNHGPRPRSFSSF